MTRAVEAAHREELSRAGLFGKGALARLFALLRAAPETHLSLVEVMRMATRLPTTKTEPVFDTFPEPHGHLSSRR